MLSYEIFYLLFKAFVLLATQKKKQNSSVPFQNFSVQRSLIWAALMSVHLCKYCPLNYAAFRMTDPWHPDKGLLIMLSRKAEPRENKWGKNIWQIHFSSSSLSHKEISNPVL